MTRSPETPDAVPAASGVQLFEPDGTHTRFAPGEWREAVLPAEVEAAWDDAERLRTLAELALEDGLDRSALLAAERLTALRPSSSTCACLLARILRGANDLEAAKGVLQAHIDAAGGSATILAELGRLHAMSGERRAARELLRRSLALDPNDRDTLDRWRDTYREPSAEAPFGTLGNGNRDTKGQVDGDAVEACLVDIAGEPGAWRPQVELGRLALARGEDGIALDCFRSAIARSSGDGKATHTVVYELADAGRIEDLVALARELGDLESSTTGSDPDPNVQGIFERLKKGRAIVSDLLERELPLLAHHFEELGTSLEPEEEIETDAEGQLVLEFAPGKATAPRPARLQRPAPPVDPTAPLRTFSYRAPLWGRLLREALTLLPVKPPTSPRVTCFAASDAASSLDPTERQAESERSLQVAMLPVYLTELLSLTTEARADCTLPYNDEQGLLQQVGRYDFPRMQSACEAEACDYLVGCHSYRDLGQSWLEVIVWDVTGGTQIAELRRSVNGDVGQTMEQIGADLVSTLRIKAGIEGLDRHAAIPMPRSVDSDYLSALADLLDLALVEVGIPPGTDCTPAQRYERLLALARRPASEILYRVMAVAAFAEGVESAGPAAPPSTDTSGSVQALLQVQDPQGHSLATLLPTLGPRFATP